MKTREFYAFVARAAKIILKYVRPRESRHKLAIEQYPDPISGRGSQDMFPKYRGYLSNDLDKCTGCGDCLPVCPVSALGLDAEMLPGGDMKVRGYSIDLGKCYSCGACVEICPVSSLYFTKKYEMAPKNKEDLLVKLVHTSSETKVDIGRIRTYEVRR